MAGLAVVDPAARADLVGALVVPAVLVVEVVVRAGMMVRKAKGPVAGAALADLVDLEAPEDLVVDLE